MEFDANIEHLRLAFWNVVMAAGPILGIALAIGLVIGIIQAATSINEMTLSFIPKLVALVLILTVFGSWQISVLVDFTRKLFERIPTMFI